jgi:phosphoglycerol transferase MdoB-like AlkP superfamily enzyme
MNEFFSHNGFEVIDRTDFNEDEISFANVWGVCDEDLLDKTLKEADKSYAKQEHFFNFVMTTSNHRPYTYPENKIDIPSHSGRSGGVKYTDYALNEFLIKAKKKPWFKDTIFVIVADHNGGSAGKNTLPTWRYKIPCIVYAPDIIKPKVVSKLSSQIDIMPTLFALMGWSYKSMFYGEDILSDTFKERAFIGNYQKLGLLQKDKLLVLTPDKKIHKYKILQQTLRSVKYEDDKNISQEESLDIISYYQSAAYLYKHNLNRYKVEK